MSLKERADSFCLTILGREMSVYDLLTQLFQIYGEHCGNVGDGQIISYRMRWRSWSPTVLFKGMLPIVNIQAHIAKGSFKRQTQPTLDLSLPTEANGSQSLSPRLSLNLSLSLSLPFLSPYLPNTLFLIKLHTQAFSALCILSPAVVTPPTMVPSRIPLVLHLDTNDLKVSHWA